jgi:FMN phosphatase YigB (HAD superfamily)
VGRAQQSAQRDCTQWRSYRELAGEALAAAYSELELAGNPATDIEVLLGSVGTWPLWPDVQTNVTALSQRYRLGLLSNVDDDIAALTRALPLVSPNLVFTSQGLRAYKPGRRIYTEATRLAGSLVHVATSGRDVAGALRAGVRVIRLLRPGHVLELGSPKPEVEITNLNALGQTLAQLQALGGAPGFPS